LEGRDEVLDRLTIERIDAASGDGPILIALSGGGDSVALLHLLAERFGADRLRAAIIDHRLREGSGEDAARARRIAQSGGVDARILELSWPQGANRAHEAARSLRYAALCGHARSLGARVIATGHTRDDQAETVLLRASRGSGLRGLVGMRAFLPTPIWPEGRGLWLARPLLRTRRGELRTYLKGRCGDWIEDPSNENVIHARVRVRRLLAELEGDLDPMRFAALAERLQAHVELIDKHAASLIVAAVAFHDDEIVIKRKRWRGGNAVKQRALDVLITAASGAERGPTSEQIESISAALDEADFAGATLGGAWLQPRAAGVVIRRDPGALAGRADGASAIEPLLLKPREETVWDGRVSLTANEPGWCVIFDDGAPQLQRGEERRPLAAAAPHWLVKTRVQHLLGWINAA
jgi:tRNA(Ile)-lysidine synthase